MKDPESNTSTADVSTEQLSAVVMSVVEKLAPQPPKTVWVVQTELKREVHVAVFADKQDALADAADWFDGLGFTQQASEVRDGACSAGTEGGDYWAEVYPRNVIMKKG